MKKTTLKLIDEFFSSHENLTCVKEQTVEAINVLLKSAESGKILVCGNGGSAADSEHISGELLKAFRLKREIPSKLKSELAKLGEKGVYAADNLEGGIKCIPLTSLNSAITAYSNDKFADLSYAQLVNALGEKGDSLIAISTSGNAENVYLAALTARAKGVKVVSLTGGTGGKLSDVSDAAIISPEKETYLVQETHLPIYHLICAALENEIFGE
ncbi:MAG: SIS domain-containing protein [Clostridia bacterium]|nr:SIS domain-containing protein [Clostridia bacterium]